MCFGQHLRVSQQKTNLKITDYMQLAPTPSVYNAVT
jgi:hypothetical protein